MQPERSAVGRGRPVGRRIVLGLLGVGVAGVLGGGAVQKGLAAVLGPLGTHDPTGFVGLIPVGEEFRFYSVTFGAPRRDAADYRLDIGGLVETPRSHTLADLQAMPQTTLVRDFQCVTGWRVPEVRWSGVRLADLIDDAGPASAARAVRFSSFDGTYTESLTFEQARRDDVIVALTMIDDSVTHDHGGPVRLYVAPMYGYKSVKWLSAIELTARSNRGTGNGAAMRSMAGSANRTDVTMTRPVEPRVPPLHRFDRVERWVHWLTGFLVVMCIVTAAILYNGSIAVLVGNRHVVETVHVWCGFALPVPLVLGLVSIAYRTDLGRLNRFTSDDWRWLRWKSLRRTGVGVGKFNAGQKINGALSAGSILVLLGTGTVMFFPDWTRLAWRTGATFVHDWFALAFGMLVVGHIVYALRDREAMRGMIGGSVEREWANDEHPVWAAEFDDDE